MKSSSAALGELEQLVLLALLRLGEHAYGIAVGREIEARSGRSVGPASIYTTLSRLEAKHLVTSQLGAPTPERGGRRKRYYRLTVAGRRLLAASLHTIRRMSEGLETALDSR